MLLLLLCCLAQTELPVLDPIAGEQISADTAAALPSGRHLGWQADHLFPSIINTAPGDGGLSRFDRLAVSAHGRSVTQLKLLLNDIDITDPALPGSALLEIPNHAWDTLTHRSLWTSQPGFAWSIAPPPAEERRYETSAGYGGPLGGGTWIPRGMMDREPAGPYGAPSARRTLTDAREIEVQAQAQHARLFAEHVQDERQFPLTYVDEASRALTSQASRTSLIGSYGFDIGTLPFVALAAWQQSADDGAGAAYRWPREHTGNDEAHSFLAQLSNVAHHGEWRIASGYGFGYRNSSFERDNTAPLTKDLEGEWLWMARPRLNEALSRWSNDLHVSASRKVDLDTWDLGVRASYAELTSRAAPPGDVVGTTYLRASNGTTRAYLDVYEPSRQAREWLGAARTDVTWRRSTEGYSAEAFVGLDFGATGTKDALQLGTLAPALGAAVRKPLAEGELFALVRREPDSITAEVSSFLDEARPSGWRYTWLDNGDGLADANEAGALVQRFGQAHVTADGLRRPTSNQFAIGYTTPTFAHLRLTVAGIGRLHLDRYTVRYDDDTLRGFSAVALSTGSTGDYRVPYASSAPSTVYARTGEAGEEVYELTNDDRPDFWLGTELTLTTVDTLPWFFSLSGQAYWNAGAAPFGSFADRNDPGVISEASADPNAQINDFGRYDQDRSFTIRVLAGRTFWDCLLLSTALRYRDGEPFVDVGVVEGLPQGPVPLMLERRGRVRHTFHMSLDVRTAYTHAFVEHEGLSLTVAGEIFNLLGSGTEQLEDAYSGDTFRQSLEMVPGRSAFVRATVAWR